MTLRALAGLVIAVAAAACPARTPPPVIGEGEGEGEGECLTATLGPVTFNFQDDVSTHYQAEILSELDGAAPDFLVLQFFNYNERIGDLGIGTFPLDDEINDNYGHCAECLLVFADQIGTTGTPERVFFQSGGTIRLEKNPRDGIDLFGAIEDLVLVESTIGGESLESAPVPGGDCLALGDVPFDIKFVPDGWTCDEALFNADDGVCDCDCGVPDNDCFPNFGELPPTTTTGCTAEQTCTFEGCRDSCDAFAGEGCPGATDVCTFADPVDFCVDSAAIDTAALGEPCSNDFNRFWCAIDATIPFGLCDVDLDQDGTRTCRARCASAADCATDEYCFTIVGGFKDGTGRGYCELGDAP